VSFAHTPNEGVRPSPVRRLVAAVLGCVVALLFVEGAVRVSGLAELPVTKRLLVEGDGRHLQYHCYPDDPDDRFRPVPSVTEGDWLYYEMRTELKSLPLASLHESPWCVEYRREIEGVRGPRITQFPAEGVVRVAGIGDSFAYGEGVSFTDSLFAQMQELAGARAEIVNVAESGADFDLDVEQVGWAFDQLSCTRALVVFVANDVGLSEELRGRNERVFDLINVRAAHLSGDDARPWWARFSRLGELVDQRRQMDAITERTIANYRDAYDPDLNGAALDELEEQFRGLATRPEGPVALVLYPLMFRLGDYPLAAEHERVARMAHEAGLPVLDLAPTFAAEDERELWVHPVDHHPNPRAHAIAARAIVDWLESEVPGFLAR